MLISFFFKNIEKNIRRMNNENGFNNKKKIIITQFTLFSLVPRFTALTGARLYVTL